MEVGIITYSIFASIIEDVEKLSSHIVVKSNFMRDNELTIRRGGSCSETAVSA